MFLSEGRESPLDQLSHTFPSCHTQQPAVHIDRGMATLFLAGGLGSAAGLGQGALS